MSHSRLARCPYSPWKDPGNEKAGRADQKSNMAPETKKTAEIRGSLVLKGGVEPPRPFGHTDLNRARLPIPPLEQ